MEINDEVVLKLFIIGCSPASGALIENLKLLLDKSIKHYTLEIIDILKNPQQTLADNILASPTLIKVLPRPEKRIVGHFPFKTLISELNLPRFENNY